MKYNQKELLSDEKIVDALLELDDPEDIQLVLSGRGYELELDEIEQIRDMAARELRREQKLPDELLDFVVGGRYSKEELRVFRNALQGLKKE